MPDAPSEHPDTRVTLFGVDVDAITLAQAVVQIDRLISSGSSARQVSVNASKFAMLDSDTELADIIAGSALVCADGMSVVWAARALRSPLPERVTGVDLFFALLELSAQRGYRPYFLGGGPGVAEEAATLAAKRFPGLQIAGTAHGYFDDAAEAAERVRETSADMLFVALGSPRQERFIAHWQSASGAPFAMGVGGSFDILAGRISRSPELLQRFGMEWLYRIAKQPRRAPTAIRNNLWMVRRTLAARFLDRR